MKNINSWIMKMYCLATILFISIGIVVAQPVIFPLDTSITRIIEPLELGLHTGVLRVSGDVDQSLVPGFGIGLHIRKAVNSALSFRGEGFYGKTSGLDAIPSGQNLIDQNNIFAGYGEENPWFFAYQTKIVRFSLQGLLELTNLGTEKYLRKLNVYVYGGLGFNSHGTKLNLRDSDHSIYTDLLVRTGYNTINDPNTSKGRRSIRKELKSIYDSSFETDAPKEYGRFRLGDETNIFPEISFGVGITQKIGRSLNVSLDHQFIISNTNYLDGKVWRSGSDQTNGNDHIQYTSLRIAYSLNRHTQPEPLYWSNPWNELQMQFDSINKQTSEIKQGLADDDGDGVINSLDLQLNSKTNIPVNSKGQNIRQNLTGSDTSAISGGSKEILSRLNQLENKYASQNEELQKMKTLQLSVTNLQSRLNALVNAMLPIVYFESESDFIHSDGLKVLAEISSILTISKITCIVITGHADEHHSDAHNQALSLKRAAMVKHVLQEKFGLRDISITLQAFGEKHLQISNAVTPQEHGVNRRVVIQVCD